MASGLPDISGLPDLLVAGGLEVRLSVSGGTLSPTDSLAAAGDWARRVRDALVPHGFALTERLPADGLIELVVESGAGSVGGPGRVGGSAEPATVVDAAAAVTAPVVASAGAPSVGPDPQVERVVARVFSELLNGPVDVTTPFFRLGASSLTVVLAHRRLRAELDAELTVVDMFAHPSVRELATFITTRREPPIASSAPGEPPATLAAPDEPPAGEPATGASTRASARLAARAHAAELAR